MDRYALIRRHADFALPFPYTAARLEEIGWRMGSLQEMLTSKPGSSGPSTSRRLLVSQEIVSALKAFALGGTKGDELRQTILSTNDVMCALLLYGEALTATDPNQKLKQLIVVNSRARLRELSYFGNAVAHLMLEFTADFVINSTFSELCLAVRRGVANFDLQKIKEGTTIFYTVVEQERPEAILRIAIPFLTSFVTNWSKFDIFGNDFGTGRPSIFLRKDFTRPGFYFVVPHPTLPNSSYWHLSLHPTIANWLDNLDLTNPSSFLPRA